MIRHFFIEKSCTIVKKSLYNTGLNPILKLNYGKDVSRGIIYFDISEMKTLVDDKTFCNLDKLYFRLNMTNCLSIDGVPYEKDIITNNEYKTKRASSFDLVIYELPQSFDAGRGFDYVSDFWIKDKKSITENGCNWYFSNNGKVWKIDEDKVDLEKDVINWKNIIRDYNLTGGIYEDSEIIDNIEKFKNGEDSFVVGMQHFDFGDESLSIDLTSYIKDLISGKKKNNGLCISFTPELERTITKEQQHVSFFTNHTNTFFHPYIEADYREYITDDRQTFAMGKDNKLYFYSYIDGVPVNLDNIPKCNIDDKEFEVKQATKGVYYIDINISRNDGIEPNSILYDNWSEIVYNGETFDDVENEFVVSPYSRKFSFGVDTKFEDILVPTISGLNDGEKLGKKETLTIIVDFRKKYTTDKKALIDSAEYRIYTEDGNREIDVIGFTPIEKSFLNNYFTIETGDLIPGNYFVDIKVKNGKDCKIYKEVTYFSVKSNVTNRYF